MLGITFLSLCLTACAKQSLTCELFLQPTVIDGPYKNLDDIARDPKSTTRDLIDFGGSAEDALKRANGDKESARKCLAPTKEKTK